MKVVCSSAWVKAIVSGFRLGIGGGGDEIVHNPKLYCDFRQAETQQQAAGGYIPGVPDFQQVSIEQRR